MSKEMWMPEARSHKNKSEKGTILMKPRSSTVNRCSTLVCRITRRFIDTQASASLKYLQKRPRIPKRMFIRYVNQSDESRIFNLFKYGQQIILTVEI